MRRHGSLVIANVGSVGLPRVGLGMPGLPVSRDVVWAEYGILDVAGEHHSMELRHIPLHLPQILTDARASELPEYDR